MANIELDGTNKKIKVDSGDLTLDVPGDIILDEYDGRALLDINDGGFVGIYNGATGPGQLRLYEDTDNGTNYSAFQVGTQSGDITYTLPTADGSSGQVLSTNGSGTLSWATAGGSDPSSADGDTLGTASAEWSDLYLADGSVIYFGNDQEIKLTHVADTGLTLKHTATADDKPISLTLQTGETDIAQDDVIGKIDFQAPDEGTGTDAILVAAGIEAVSEGDFSSSNNATKLSFKTAASEAAAEKMSLSSAGLLTVTGGITMTGTTPTLTIGDAGAEDTKIVFDGNAQDWHIGLDDTDDDFKIGLGSTLGTTSHIVIDEAGHVTKPLQPAFHVQHGNLANKTGNGTLYAIVMSSENFDVNGDWSSATFTAPVTGKYFFSMTVHFENITGDKRSHLQIQASNRALERYFQSDPESNNVDGAHLSGLVDMDASDTVQFRVTVHGVGGDTVDITDYSHYQGFLVC